jgi:hypothetical protein
MWSSFSSVALDVEILLCLFQDLETINTGIFHSATKQTPGFLAGGMFMVNGQHNGVAMSRSSARVLNFADQDDASVVSGTSSSSTFGLVDERRSRRGGADHHLHPQPVSGSASQESVAVSQTSVSASDM